MKKVIVCLSVLINVTAVSAQKNTRIASVNFNPACSEGSMHLYPAAPNDYMNIYVDWNQLQPFTVYVYKDDNELVTQWQGDTKKNYEHALFTSKMGPGNYHIKIKSPRAEMSEPFSVAH